MANYGNIAECFNYLDCILIHWIKFSVQCDLCVVKKSLIGLLAYCDNWVIQFQSFDWLSGHVISTMDTMPEK